MVRSSRKDKIPQDVQDMVGRVLAHNGIVVVRAPREKKKGKQKKKP